MPRWIPSGRWPSAMARVLGPLCQATRLSMQLGPRTVLGCMHEWVAYITSARGFLISGTKLRLVSNFGGDWLNTKVNSR